jgi:hypothetical protein
MVKAMLLYYGYSLKGMNFQGSIGCRVFRQFSLCAPEAGAEDGTRLSSRHLFRMACVGSGYVMQWVWII